MNQIIAFFTLNIKMIKKDLIPMLWSILMPSIFLILNKNQITEVLDLRYWWAYIIVTSYVFGVGLHALVQKEAGTLKTAFSIHNKPYTFFVANLFTQIIYCIVCIGVFNILVFLIYKFNIIELARYSLLIIFMTIPFAFFSYNITLLKIVHVNSLSTIANIIIFILFIGMNYQSELNKFNPLIYFSNVIVISSIKNFVAYIVLACFLIGISIYSIINFNSIPNERR